MCFPVERIKFALILNNLNFFRHVQRNSNYCTYQHYVYIDTDDVSMQLVDCNNKDKEAEERDENSIYQAILCRVSYTYYRFPKGLQVRTCIRTDWKINN